MYGISGSPMDPINSLKFMLSKLHSECEALFQTPLINFGKSGTCWYKNEPLGKNTIAQLMPKISEKAGVSLFYTAHCVRASTITSLHQVGLMPSKFAPLQSTRMNKASRNELALTSSAVPSLQMKPLVLLVRIQIMLAVAS